MAVVHRVAELDEQRAAEVLASLRNQLQQAQRQLQEFIDYRADYLRNAPQYAGVKRVNPRDLTNFVSFVAQLDDVIERQREVVAGIDEQYQRAIKIWQQKQRYQKKIAEFRDNALESEQVTQEKKLQAQIDDAGARRIYHPGN